MASNTTTPNADFVTYAGIHSTILAAMDFLNNLHPIDIDPIPRDLHCAICSSPPSSPIRLPTCGHIFCKACIMAWLTPFDREAPEPLTVEFVELPHDGNQNQIQEAMVGVPEMRSAEEEEEEEEEETHNGDEREDEQIGEEEEEDDEAKDEEGFDWDGGVLRTRRPSRDFYLSAVDADDRILDWDEEDEERWQRVRSRHERERDALAWRVRYGVLNEQRDDVDDTERNHLL
ncbi:MAG: hypothetical protein Q9183_007492, partial [Haloplaca sp. 2 TL-2023]